MSHAELTWSIRNLAVYGQTAKNGQLLRRRFFFTSPESFSYADVNDSYTLMRAQAGRNCSIRRACRTDLIFRAFQNGRTAWIITDAYRVRPRHRNAHRRLPIIHACPYESCYRRTSLHCQPRGKSWRKKAPERERASRSTLSI